MNVVGRYCLAWALVPALATALVAAPPPPAGPRAAAKPQPSQAAPPVAPVKLDWTESFVQATQRARQSNKIILAHFQGSDWCEWSKKLEKEVIQTPVFAEWAKQNVILLKVDYPSPDTKQPRGIAKQNEILAATYNVAKLPTLLFLDQDGEVIDRAGYDSACLREDEKKGAPVQAMARFESILKARPTGQQAKTFTFAEAAETTEKTGQSILVLITRPEAKAGVETRDRLLNSGKFAKFVNTNTAFVNLNWPDDSDQSPQAKWFRTFAEGYKIGPAPVQLVMFTYGGRKVQHKVTSIDQIDGLINQLAQQLPKFDYNGTWLTNYRQAQSIAAQTQRDILLSFTSFDSSDFCKKLDAEIYQTDAFKDYARKNLVLVRVDFPTETEQSEELKTQNTALAEGYNVRGYPTLILLNPKSQKIGMAKYQPGGPDPLIKEIEDLRRREFDRRTLMSEQVEVQKKKPAPAQ